MITTYDVFKDMLDLRKAVKQVLGEVADYSVTAEYPLVNLYEKDDHLEVELFVPGVKREDISIQLIEDGLSVEGERKVECENKKFIRTERSFGSFKKMVRLPYSVDPEKVEATLNDGVLLIKLEKSEAAKPKKIAIN